MQHIPQRSMENSNYLVTNDDLSVMDLPRNMTQVPNMSSYSSKGQKSSSTPLLIPPLKYIVYNNPQVVYDFLISKGYNVDNRIPSAYQFAKIYVRENGEQGILDIVRVAHPDMDIIKKALGLDKKESSFDGGSQETKPAAKEEAPKEPVKSNEFNISTKTIIIILVIVVFFLLINRASK